MKNRYIVTPKDKRAEELLDFNEAGDHDLIQLVLSESQFYQLDACGVFSDLNNMLGCLIDDFEDEAITDKQQLEKGLKYLKNLRPKDDRTQKLMEEIICLFEEAVKRQTGVYFFF
ncbi:hypothetical protein [Sphingobacterium sp.]|uniref:hypothetical protein n=1 Tax=Sphingobacterium sp. TaxID=341027 RepID=UPI00289F3941|nr:hypothetical protein [Sphingobacterium sp.]